MNDALTMRTVQRISDLDRARERLVERQRSFRQPRGERFAVDELHDEKVDALIVADVMDGADVRMVERCHRARLPLEPGSALRIGGPTAGRIFRRRRGRAACRSREHFAHAARADCAFEAVGAELMADERRCGPRRQRVFQKDAAMSAPARSDSTS